MIILLGPDGAGKTTLAKLLCDKYSMTYVHHGVESGYNDYIKPLVKLEWTNAVLDRHAVCEVPYSAVMNRQFKFSNKQFHNIMLMTLIQKPLIILCVRKPKYDEYDHATQYLPYEKWDACMAEYLKFLFDNNIAFKSYTYGYDRPLFQSPELYHRLQENNNADMEWWMADWRAHYGCGGSATPKYLIVAERIGPSNTNNIVFEAGPTGLMLSEVLERTHTPLGDIAITNMVKSYRGDPREANEHDMDMLREEIIHLKPRKVIFMGSISKKAAPMVKEMGCEVGSIVHLGALNHKGIKDLSGYSNEWSKLLNLTPTVEFK